MEGGKKNYCYFGLAFLIPVMALISNMWPNISEDHNIPYQSTSNYILLSAAEKAELLWSNCMEDTESASWPNTKKRLESLLGSSMCPSFLTPGDAMPPGRIKFIHTVGAVGRVEWKNTEGHPYTGVFRGAKHGIARFSLGVEADNRD